MDLLYKALDQFNIEYPKHFVNNKIERWGENARYWAKAVNDGFIFGDWVAGISESIFPKAEKQYTKEEWAKRRREIQQARKEAEVEQLEQWETIALKALDIWNKTIASPPLDFPYIVRKQIKTIGIKYNVDKECLVVPLRDENAKLWSLQFINKEGEKRFLSGGRKKGCYFSIGKPNSKIIVCEGVATGLSIYEATQNAVAAAFDKGNLEEVIKNLQKKYPALELIIAADNDIKENSPNVGVEEAQRISAKYGYKVAIPTLKSGGKCDFNDLMIAEGTETVKSAFDNLTKPDVENNRTTNEPLEINKRTMSEQREKLPEGYCLSDDYLLYTGGDGEPQKVSGRIEVIARTRDDNSRNWGKLLSFCDADNVNKEIAIPYTMFAGDCRELREVLLSEGLEILPSGKGKLSSYLMLCSPSARMLCVNKTGWYKNVYVLPDTIIGKSVDLVRFQSESINNIYKIKGTTDEWKENISKYCQGNSRLTFAVSSAFASILLNIVGLESGGFHFVGGSSCGKSTILKVAASVLGGSDYLRNWRATDNGLEGIASLHNDSLLILDEMGQVDPNKVGEIAYMLANGSGKARANRNGNAKNLNTWRLLFLSSGEIDLSTHLGENKKKSKAGQEIRLLNIPAIPTGESFGAFENIHNMEDGDKFSKYLCEQVKEYYGTPSRKFIEYVVNEINTINKGFKEDLAAFKESVLPSTASEQDKRAFNRFALVGFAGEYATSKGLTGWQEGDAYRAANKCFNDWSGRRGGLGNQEDKAILSKIQYFFEQNGESRFYDLTTDKGDKTINMAGYKRKDDNNKVEYLVFPQTFNNDICDGFDKKQAKDILFNAGWINSKDSQQVKIKYENKRFYIFNPKMWEY